jgi:hypothetical protein
MKVNYLVFAFFIVILLQGMHSRESVQLYDASTVLTEQSISKQVNISLPQHLDSYSLNDFAEVSNPAHFNETNYMSADSFCGDVSCSIFTMYNSIIFLTNFNF